MFLTLLNLLLGLLNLSLANNWGSFIIGLINISIFYILSYRENTND